MANIFDFGRKTFRLGHRPSRQEMSTAAMLKSDYR